jgi:AraC-like DNA-binding protein
MIHAELLRRLCRARDLVRDWEKALLSVNEVARRTGFSCFHFIRLFKAVFGETPHQYQSQAQIEQAKHLLVLSDSSVTDVCMAVGFSSLGSFSALFSRRVGISPSSFQQRYRSLAGNPRTLPPCLIPGCFSLMGRVSPKSAISEKRRPDAFDRLRDTYENQTKQHLRR